MNDGASPDHRYPEWAEVHDPAQAEVLTDPLRLRFLVPFLGRARTVGAVAAELGSHPDTVLYRVRTLTDVGLLRVDREEPRRGRAIKHYRATADGYFVPFHASPYADLEEDLRANWQVPFHTLVANMAALLRSAGIEGHRVYRVGDAVHVESAPSLDRPLDLAHPDLRHATVMHRTVRLTPEEAERLQAELNDVLQRYGEGDDDERRRPYLTWGALVPHVVRAP
jgi:hypothetical protein